MKKKDKITQQIIADKLGVTQASVSHWLSGKIAPSKMAMKLIKDKYPQLLEQIDANSKLKTKD